MSKETFEVFEETDQHIPFHLDRVQQAVDHYYEETRKLPVVSSDPHRRISYPLLLSRFYLKEMPPVTFYLTDQENLITHRSPEQFFPQ